MTEGMTERDALEEHKRISRMIGIIDAKMVVLAHIRVAMSSSKLLPDGSVEAPPRVLLNIMSDLDDRFDDLERERAGAFRTHKPGDISWVKP